MSRWQKPTLVVALVVVVPSNCTQLLSNSTHPSSLRSQVASQEEQVAVLEQLSTFLTLSLPDPENNELVCAARSEAVTARRFDQMVMYTYTHTKS